MIFHRILYSNNAIQFANSGNLVLESEGLFINLF